MKAIFSNGYEIDVIRVEERYFPETRDINYTLNITTEIIGGLDECVDAISGGTDVVKVIGDDDAVMATYTGYAKVNQATDQISDDGRMNRIIMLQK